MPFEPTATVRGVLARTHREERGAETVEFAFAGPVVLLLVVGVLYLLLAVAAQVSLHHAVSQGTRFATIPTDMVATTYPSTQEVEDRLAGSTPFFTGDSCSTSVTGEERQNAPVVVDVTCAFPNPIAGALNGLSTVFGGSGDTYDDSLDMSARATGRRE